MPTPADALLKQILRAREGVTLADLLARHPAVARRTAQRWLGQWVSQGRIRAIGEARNRRYAAAVLGVAEPPSWGDPGPTSAQGNAGFAVPLSADSRDILAYVEQAPGRRHPVGYQREFLEAYRPNETRYLSASLCRQLAQMGQTDDVHAPAGTYSRAILGRLLIDLSWASSHLEGNTYTRLDTRELLEHGKVAQGKAALETQMILNHKAAIELLVTGVASPPPGQAGFDRYTVMNLHSVLSENLLPNPADEGRIRQHAVDIGGSVYRPMSVLQQLEEMLDLLLAKARRIKDPFEQSFFTMVHLPYLQPFADVNKRTSRLLANLPLFRANLCPLTFVDLPPGVYSQAVLGVYELTRVELLRDVYVWAYERSTREYLAIRQNLGQPDPLRLAYRDFIRQTIHEVVIHPERDAFAALRQAVEAGVPQAHQAEVQSLLVGELRRLHEGALARYGLRPSEWAAWRARQGT